MGKKVLAIIDPQNDFITGSLAVGLDQWNKAYSEIEKLVCSNKYSIIFVTKDVHPVTHCSFKKQGGIWPSHCVQGTNGCEIFDSLQNLLKKISIKVKIINKGQNENVEEYGVDLLKNEENIEQIEQIDMTGLCFDYCVAECAKLTAAAYPHLQINILKNACVAKDETKHVVFSAYPNINVVK
ncbi:MAG: isochorismatase family protein [Alphaproteobacteria bacterium]|nr:isochorismatase family protein [Alphaproteobacteria bacterium]